MTKMSQVEKFDRVQCIAGVRQWALDHYHQDGWDILVDSWDDATIDEVMGNATTPNGAAMKCYHALKDLKPYWRAWRTLIAKDKQA